MTSNKETRRLAHLMIGHGLCVLMAGLLAGLMLAIVLVGGLDLWPFPKWDIALPGSARGWAVAHAGGILNGVMISGAAPLALYLELQGRTLKWVAWGMIITGWANTVFYWAGNLAANHGLSAGSNAQGAASLAGTIAYGVATIGMLFTFVAVFLLARAAFARLTQD